MITGEVAYLYRDKQDAFLAQQTLLDADAAHVVDAKLQTLIVTSTPIEIIDETFAYMLKLDVENVLVSDLTTLARKAPSYLGLAYVIIESSDYGNDGSSLGLDINTRIAAFMIAAVNSDGSYNLCKNRYTDSDVRTNYCTLEFIRELMIGIMQQKR